MINSIKSFLILLYLLLVYLLLTILIKYYIDWVIDKSIIWIIVITFPSLIIMRLILNYIPIGIGKLTENTNKTLKIASAISLTAKTVYLAFILLITKFNDTKSIIISVFLFLLFYVCSNFLAHGIVHHTLTHDKDDTL